MEDDKKILTSDGRMVGAMEPATGMVGPNQIYFGVTVSNQRAEYLALCLDEPLCSHCGRELAECDADPCPSSPHAVRARDRRAGRVPVDPAEYRGNDYGDDDKPASDVRVMQDAVYVGAVKKTSNQCPICKSHHIEGYSIEVDGATANQKVHCGECEATWYDLYALVGFALKNED